MGSESAITISNATNIIRWPDNVRKGDVGLVGGKAANLGELTAAGFPVPPHFTVTASTYFDFIDAAGIEPLIIEQLDGLDVNDQHELDRRTAIIRGAIMQSNVPLEVASAIMEAYSQLGNSDEFVAVRSSATAEDLPDASFAGQQATHLDVHGKFNVVHAVQACWASLWNARAVFYRVEQQFDHMQVGLAVVVQVMIPADRAGVMFTINSTNGNPNIIEVSAGYGLGEAVVSGEITPDTHLVNNSSWQIVDRSLAPQELMIVRTRGHNGGHDGANTWVPVPEFLQNAPKLTDQQIVELAQLGFRVQNHYGCPQDIEWAMVDGEVYLTQARPVTVTSEDYLNEDIPLPDEPAPVVLTGQAASPGIASGRIRIINGPEQCDLIQQGDILVARMTSPDYVAAMKRAAAIVTQHGGRTCHAAIVARELGIPCIVGAIGVFDVLTDHVGEVYTVDGSHGQVFEGVAQTRIAWNEDRLAEQEAHRLAMASVTTKTKVMAILADPDEAHKVAAGNVDGVGLLRMEFALAQIGRHPKDFLEAGEGQLFIEQLVARFTQFCEAFGDRPVVLRLTDFKTNELRGLIGGERFETAEENPMLGLRGAARYMQHPEVFALELEAIRLVRERHQNLWVMVPFVRTVAELEWVVAFMAKHGLERSDSFKIWMMAEVPSNAILLEEFVAVGIDGVSIGSNDMTQLVLGIDRDNAHLIGVGDELNPAVMRVMEQIVTTGRRLGITVGICGQAPSDHPDLTARLVQWGVTSISVMPDAISRTRGLVLNAESQLIAS